MSKTRVAICILLLILCRGVTAQNQQNGTSTVEYVAAAIGQCCNDWLLDLFSFHFKGIGAALLIIAALVVIAWMCLWYFPTPSDDRDEYSDLTDHLISRLKAKPVSDDPVGELAVGALQVALAGLSSTSAQLQSEDESGLPAEGPVQVHVQIEPDYKSAQVQLSDAPGSSNAQATLMQSDNNSDSSSEMESPVHTVAMPKKVHKPSSPARVIHVAPRSNTPAHSQIKPVVGADSDSRHHKHNPPLQRPQARSLFSTSSSTSQDLLPSHQRKSFRLRLVGVLVCLMIIITMVLFLYSGNHLMTNCYFPRKTINYLYHQPITRMVWHSLHV